MNYTELVAHTALRAGVTHDVAKKVLDSLPDTIAGELSGGYEVAFHGLGKFKPRDRPERAGRNVRTGETIVIPATRAATFSPASTFKKVVAA